MLDTTSLPQKLKELLEDFKLITDKNQRRDMLIYYADQFEEVPKRIATKPYPEDNRVPACESQAFVWSEQQNDGTLQYYFAVENPQGISAKAMAAILDETISGETPEEILKLDEEIVYEFFGKGISMGKGMGLKSMIKVVKSHAFQKIEEDK